MDTGQMTIAASDAKSRCLVAGQASGIVSEIATDVRNAPMV